MQIVIDSTINLPILASVIVGLVGCGMFASRILTSLKEISRLIRIVDHHEKRLFHIEGKIGLSNSHDFGDEI